MRWNGQWGLIVKPYRHIASLSVDHLCGTVCLTICGLRTPRWTLSRTNWKHLCLMLTRISASAASANLGYTSVIIIIITWRNPDARKRAKMSRTTSQQHSTITSLQNHSTTDVDSARSCCVWQLWRQRRRETVNWTECRSLLQNITNTMNSWLNSNQLTFMITYLQPGSWIAKYTER